MCNDDKLTSLLAGQGFSQHFVPAEQEQIIIIAGQNRSLAWRERNQRKESSVSVGLTPLPRSIVHDLHWVPLIAGPHQHIGKQCQMQIASAERAELLSKAQGCTQREQSLASHCNLYRAGMHLGS